MGAWADSAVDYFWKIGYGKTNKRKKNRRKKNMAKKQKIVKLRGVGQWTKVFEETRDMTGWDGSAEEWGGTYQVDMFLDEENEAKLKKSGSAKKVKDPKESDYEGAEGNKYSFQRKHLAPFTDKKTGEQVIFGPPKVLKSDGTAWDLDEDGLIGNGSELEVTLVVYPTTNPKTNKPGIPGTRLEKVKVLNHVEYISEDEYDGEEDEEEPEEEVEEKPKKARKVKKEELDDEIPF